MEQLSTYDALKRHARPLIAGLALGLSLIWAENAWSNPAQPLDFNAQNIAETGAACSRAIAQAERREGIPHGLLAAISLAESGRWDGVNKANVAWPWTVTTGGEGHFLPSRVDAMAFVRSLKADGVQNIDVGCMQINLKYHPDAFDTVEQAFDPDANAAYAAKFLSERFQVTKSWILAAGQYHSTTPELNRAYRAKITRLWRGGASPEPAGPTRHMASAADARVAVARPDFERTRRLNDRFQAQRAAGGLSAHMSPEARVIANRARALKPGAFTNASTTRAERFQQKRQSQLQAWRARNGLGQPVGFALPVSTGQ